MQSNDNSIVIEDGNQIINQLIDVILANREYLSEIDGAIGDGDHGINMAKGFQLCRDAIAQHSLDLSESLQALSDALMEGIGGSMGPLYGCLFMGMSEHIKGQKTIDKQLFATMLNNGLAELQSITTATVGDKCLMDSLIPAVNAFNQAVNEDKSFKDALSLMKQASIAGRDSTIDLIAKIGRASRLGERSRGVLDAGATSCSLLLNALADALLDKLAKV